ncbi:MAG: TolC family protein [candidate division KSB1 bacterium]|nr:TolC family protein [candidate division KSB1 bacterium]MDZ7368708.1 TolC family protein [candidate division KSB1 bacterium]MDZ7406551.1 TolC family protein [candidate division KSB1 bacterium]
MKHVRWIFVAGCWMLITAYGLLVTDAVAQPAGEEMNGVAANGKVLRLEEAQRIALEKNLQLQAARKGAQAASWGVKNAYTQFLPSVNIGLSYVRLDEGTLDRANAFYNFANDPVTGGFLPDEIKRNIRPGAYRNSYGPSISVTQPIFTGGTLLANVSVAQAQDLTAQANLAATEQQVIYNTQRAYFDVLRAHELVAVAKDQLQTAEEHLHSARKQVEAGLRSKTEILRWEVQKANAESFLARAENGLALARPALNQVLGLELNAEYTVAPVDDVPVEIPATVDEQIATALRKNPGQRVMEANVDLAGAQVKVERANFTPKVSLAYNYSWEANNTLRLDSFKTWSLGIVAQFPIFNSFRDYTNLQKAQATKQQTENLQQDFERGLRLQVLQTSQNLDLARKQLTLTEKAKAQAEENFRVIKHSYEVGLASNLDFLDAQNAQSQARWDHVNARYDYLLAKTALAQAMGVLKQ